MNFGNLHAIASALIPQQQATIERFTGNVTNPMGYTVPSYAAPEPITGSVQPMAAQDAQKLGLDFRKVTATLHTSADVALAGPGTQPDRITYAGRVYEPIAVTDWAAQDGWRVVTMVAV